MGGWASSTVSGAHTRRYHGLLVVATQPPVGRVVLLSRLDETLVLPTARVELSCSIFPGVIHPRSDQWLTAFASEPVPTWTYAEDGWVLRKRLALLAGEHALVVAYELVKAPSPLCLELRPFFAGRDYHHLMQANDQVSPTADWAEDALVYRPYREQPTVHLLAPGACWEAAPDWYYNFQYPREEERGLDYSEDLFTPGRLRLQLDPGGHRWRNCGHRASRLPRPPHASHRRDRPPPAGGGARSLGRRSFAAVAGAGRPISFWCGAAMACTPLSRAITGSRDWGRDTMIALPGLCWYRALCEARGIFAAFAEHVSEGMIPSRFPDAGEVPNTTRWTRLCGFLSRSTSICNTPKTTSLPANCGRR